MKKSLTTNYVYMVVFQILSLLTPIITTPYLARTLGVVGVGIFSYTYSILNWFMIISTLGTTIYGAKEIAKVRNNKDELSRVFVEIFIFQLILNVLTIIVYYLTFTLLKTGYTKIYYIQGINLFANMVNVTWFFTGIEDFKKIAFRSCLFKILSIICILIFVRGKNSLYIYTLILSISCLLGNLYIFLSLKDKVKFEKKYITVSGVLKHIKPNLLLFIPQIAISVYSILDQTMIGLLSGSTDQVAFYVKAEQLVKMFLYVITTIGTVLMPRIANLFYNHNYKTIEKYVNKTLYIILYISIPMCFGVAAIAPSFVQWFLTPEFLPAGYVMMILSPILIFISITNVLGTQYLLPTDDTKNYTISVTIGAIVNFFSNLVLIPFFGCYGAAIGTVIAELSVLIFQSVIIKKKKIIHLDIKSIILYLTGSIIMFGFVFLIGLVLKDEIITTLVQVLSGITIYLIITFIFHDETQKELIQQCKNFMKIKK